MKPQKPSTDIMAQRLEDLYLKIDETYAAAAHSNDVKAATDCIRQLGLTYEQLSKLESGKGRFESLSIDEQVQWVANHPELAVALQDDIVRRTEAAVREFKAQGYKFDPETGLLELPAEPAQELHSDDGNPHP
jgi:hypothetical protein